jgi:hypothetical protein
MLPNEYVSWYLYGRKFSKVCDGCNDEKGVYKVTYQDWKIPSTVLYPFPVRLCTDCLCEADEEVGVMNDGEGNGREFSIDRM